MKVFASAQRRLAFGAFLFVLLTGLWLFWWKKPLGRDNWFIAPRSALWPLDSWLLPLGTLLLCGGFALMCAYDRFRRAKSRREEKTSLRMSLGSLILLAAVLPWTLLGPRKISGIYLVSATWSDISNQYFSTAYRIQDARDFTRNYQLQQQNYDIVKSHVATHPPGAVLFYYGALKIYENVPLVQQLFSTIAPGITAASTPSVTQTIRGQLARSHASDANARPFHDDAVGSAIWCAFLLSLSVGLTVPAVYKLAAGESSTRNAAAAVDDAAVDDAATAISGNDALTKDASAKDALAKVEERARESRGLLGAALFALAPTTVLFAFTLDALMACLIAWSLVLIARRVTSGTTVGICSAIVSGVLIGLASFLSFGALAVWGLLVFAFAIGFGWRSFLTTPQLVLTDISSRRKPAVHRPISDLALILLGFVALWLVLSLIFPMQPREIYARAMEAHHAATLTSRSHAGWAVLNLWTFALFCGWALTTTVLCGAWTQFRNWRANRAFNWNAARVLGVATLLLCVTLSLSGSVRGETERLWFFLLPPLCAFGANIVGIEYSNARKSRLFLFLIVLQTLQTLMMAATLAPLIRAY